MSDELKIHIYPGDCDSAGHVNHAVILTLFERARWAALEKRLSFADYVRRAQWAVVRHIDADYSAPSMPGDDFIIRTGLAASGNTSFTVRQVATNQRGEKVCELKVVYVTLGKDGRPMPVPDEWREIFPPWTDA
ncbi:MAG TPA: thioesterase family protein [Gemmatimonadaceae bacterium]|nr:thioesterase family protein [Gemmatimonadaceae bacterium]